MARVLVCDDDPAILRLVDLTLEGRHRVRTVEDGPQVLAALAETRPPFELVLLDVMMPGIDGFEVLRRIRIDRQHDGMGVVMLTARVTEDDYLRGFRLGADAYVSKPFDPEVLLRTIEEVLARTPQQRRAAREDEKARAALLRRLERRFG